MKQKKDEERDELKNNLQGSLCDVCIITLWSILRLDSGKEILLLLEVEFRFFFICVVVLWDFFWMVRVAVRVILSKSEDEWNCDPVRSIWCLCLKMVGMRKRKNQKINKLRIICKKAILCKIGIEKNIREQENFNGNEKISYYCC